LGYESELSEEEKAKHLLDQRRSEFEQFWGEGYNTHRKLSEALGLRRNANEAPSIAVHMFLAEMGAPHTDEPGLKMTGG
jgi:hypothetical protein